MRRDRIATAQVSDDLGEVPESEIGDIDFIRAAGAVGLALPIGVSLWRLKFGGDGKEFLPAVSGLAELFGRRGFEDCAELVGQVVWHWCHDVCNPCLGRGYEKVPGAPVLAARQCKYCGGSGRTEFPNPSDLARQIQEKIAQYERQVGAAIMRKLADEV
jgi:hypothetical protein